MGKKQIFYSQLCKCIFIYDLSIKRSAKMSGNFTNRRAFTRVGPSGRSVYVSSTTVKLPEKTAKRGATYHRICGCGAKVISVRMKRGGWVHFEGARGLRNVKHSCAHVGEGLSKRRDEHTADLFSDESES